MGAWGSDLNGDNPVRSAYEMWATLLCSPWIAWGRALQQHRQLQRQTVADLAKLTETYMRSPSALLLSRQALEVLVQMAAVRARFKPFKPFGQDVKR